MSRITFKNFIDSALQGHSKGVKGPGGNRTLSAQLPLFNEQAFAKSCSGIMKSSGMSDETVARVVDSIIHEITVPTKLIRCKWCLASAVKA